MAAPCGWEVTQCGCGKGCWDNHTPAVRERAQASAALIMWAATGRRYGPCDTSIQPAGRRCAEPLYRTYELGPYVGGGLLSPVIDGGQWYNRPYTNGDGGLCCRDMACDVELPGPFTKANITSVIVDGVTLDADAYVVFDGRILTRVDGTCWPCCTNYSHQDPPGFVVNYKIGLDIPAAVQSAFEALACETAKACAGQACALPQQMVRLSRQGVDLEVETVDPTDATGRILTGIKDVDDVIRADNPWGMVAGPQVFSPDLPMGRRLT
jgi:hypothetical protein